MDTSTGPNLAVDLVLEDTITLGENGSAYIGFVSFLVAALLICKDCFH
jgi:hypothetical protein